jgi:hypothetical protein
MIFYIKLATLEYPRHEGDIRLEHPDILDSQTGDTFPCPETYAPVAYEDQPSIDWAVQTTELSVPVQNETGSWTATWVIRDLTPAELEAIAQANAAMNQELEQQSGPMP